MSNTKTLDNITISAAYQRTPSTPITREATLGDSTTEITSCKLTLHVYAPTPYPYGSVRIFPDASDTSTYEDFTVSHQDGGYSGGEADIEVTLPNQVSQKIGFQAKYAQSGKTKKTFTFENLTITYESGASTADTTAPSKTWYSKASIVYPNTDNTVNWDAGTSKSGTVNGYNLSFRIINSTGAYYYADSSNSWFDYNSGALLTGTSETMDVVSAIRTAMTSIGKESLVEDDKIVGFGVEFRIRTVATVSSNAVTSDWKNFDAQITITDNSSQQSVSVRDPYRAVYIWRRVT